MSCPDCGAPVQHGHAYCGQCGSPLGQACPACSARGRAGDRFCPDCGAALHEKPAALEPAPSSAPERRLVSVMFADLVGFTTMAEHRDPEEVRELLSLYFARCRTTIERYGGTLEKFIGDAVMAVWGTPVAQEDDAERAVRAALALTQAVAALGSEVGMPDLRVRAGVLTGKAIVDAANQHEGTVHGDTVNTASRLQSIAAPGAVLVDDVTRRTSEAAIVYEDAGTHQVKGREVPVRTWTALRVVAGVGGAGREAGLEAPLVGRAAELQQIIEAGERSAREGETAQLTLVGDAGTGKSRLLWEYFKYVDGIQAGRWWHEGRCLSYGEGVAFSALAEMIRTRAGIGEEEEPASARGKLGELIDRFVTDERERSLVLPRVAHLLGLEQRTVADQADLFSGWRLFFERMAATDPVVLVFEDVHWATTALLDFIDYLLEWSAHLPIYVLCLARNGLDTGLRGWPEPIRLGPLTPEEMTELLAGLVPGLPADLTARIIDRAEGVPLYAAEIVRMLLDRGLLAQEGSTYLLDGDVGDLEVPESLEALAAARLDNLTRSERSLLQDAAVLGTSFMPEALAAVSGRPEAEVRQTLDALVSKQVLAREGDARLADGPYAFLQALLRTVALGTLSLRERKVRHLAAAEFIGAMPGQTGEMAEVQASHYLDAVAIDPDALDADRIRKAAREQLAIAGEHTGSMAMPQAARRYFEQAASLTPDTAQRARLLAEAGVSASRAGEGADALVLLADAIALLEGCGLHAEAARTRAQMADALISQHRLEEAAALLDAARESVDDQAVLAEVMATRAHVAILAGDYGRAYADAEAALRIADPAGLVAVIANAEMTKAQTLFDQQRLTEAVALCSLALQLGLEADLSDQALRGYNNLAYLRVEGGQPAKALELIDAGLALARERGDRTWERDLIAQRVSLRTYRGEWDRALSEGDALREQGEDVAERAAWQTRPIILAARGEVRALEEWLARDLPDSESHEQAVDDAIARATALSAVGRKAEAATLARGAWTEVQATGRAASDVAIYFAQMVDVLLEDGGLDVLAPGFDAGTRPLPAIRGQLAWLRGVVLARRGDRSRAVAELRDACELIRQIEHPFAHARALRDLGDCLGGVGRIAEAEQALREAASIYRRLGAGPAAASAGELLDLVSRIPAVSSAQR